MECQHSTENVSPMDLMTEETVPKTHNETLFRVSKQTMSAPQLGNSFNIHALQMI